MVIYKNKNGAKTPFLYKIIILGLLSEQLLHEGHGALFYPV